MIDRTLTQEFNQSIVDYMQEFDENVSLNFVVCKDDGHVAWTATPLSIDNMYNDISGVPVSTKC